MTRSVAMKTRPEMRSIAEKLAQYPTPSYQHLSHDELAAGIEQMLQDLLRLAVEDGCIAAAWALDFCCEAPLFLCRTGASE